MAYKKFKIEIESTQPLLMHRIPVSYGNESETSTRKQKLSQAEEAEAGAYRILDGRLALPVEGFWKGLKGASGIKITGTRKMLGSLLMENGTVLFKDEDTIVGDIAGVGLLDMDDLPITTYELDTRPVTVNGSKIIRARAKIREWKCSFTIEYEDRVVTEELYRLGFTAGGYYKGMGDYRRGNGGIYFGGYGVVNPKTNELHEMDEFKI